MELETAKIDEFIARYGLHQGALIQGLQDIQGEFNSLPREALEYVSEKRGTPLAVTYNVATFYNVFSLKPKGQNHICVCMGTECHVRGAQSILDKFKRELKIDVGETPDDLKYSLDKVACVGACALGPIVVENVTYHAHMRLDKGGELLKRGGRK